MQRHTNWFDLKRGIIHPTGWIGRLIRGREYTAEGMVVATGNVHVEPCQNAWIPMSLVLVDGTLPRTKRVFSDNCLNFVAALSKQSVVSPGDALFMPDYKRPDMFH